MACATTNRTDEKATLVSLLFACVTQSVPRAQNTVHCLRDPLAMNDGQKGCRQTSCRPHPPFNGPMAGGLSDLATSSIHCVEIPHK